METIGERLRKLRLEKALSLRKVAARLHVDVAILSKMERGKRPLTKDLIRKLARLYHQDPQELLVLFLRDKLMYEIDDEDLLRKVLKAAEGKVDYERLDKTSRKNLLHKIKRELEKCRGLKKAWMYGSFARGDEGPQSDIDIAVRTEKNFSYFDLADLQYHLEQAVNRKIDIGFMDAFKPFILEQIKPDLTLLYERSAEKQP